MHEEDFGLSWIHLDYRNGHKESRRSRRLVISFIATVVRQAMPLSAAATCTYENMNIES